MPTSVRHGAPMLLAAAAAVGWGIITAAPAVAEPDDSANTSLNNSDSTALPLMRAVDPVIANIDGIWNQIIPPNSVAPWSPVTPFEQYLQPLVPTTTQIDDFGRFLQQFRPPAGITPPTG